MHTMISLQVPSALDFLSHPFLNSLVDGDSFFHYSGEDDKIRDVKT